MKNIVFLVAMLIIASNLVAFTGWELGTHDGTPNLRFQLIAGTTTDVRVGRGNVTATTFIGDVVIPSTVEIDGTTYTVRGIASTALGFRDQTSLFGVTIPSTVTQIGFRAFENTRLRGHVVIPNSVTTIEYEAFSRILISGTGFTIELPNYLTIIENNLFEGSLGLTSVIIPPSVTEIGIQAFQNTGLTGHVTIPNSVTTIENRAFSRIMSTGFTIELPDNLTTIQTELFF